MKMRITKQVMKHGITVTRSSGVLFTDNKSCRNLNGHNLIGEQFPSDLAVKGETSENM